MPLKYASLGRVALLSAMNMAHFSRTRKLRLQKVVLSAALVDLAGGPVSWVCSVASHSAQELTEEAASARPQVRKYVITVLCVVHTFHC